MIRNRRPGATSLLVASVLAGSALLPVVGAGRVADPTAEWPMLGGSPARTFYNAFEGKITRDNLESLVVKWRFPTLESVTASPAVATVDIAGTPTRLVIVGDYTGHVWALRASNGIPLWDFHAVPSPSVYDPRTRQSDYGVVTNSAAVAEVALPSGGTEQRVFVGGNDTMFALDAATGALRWKFRGGIEDPDYEIESSALVHDGRVYFGYQCNNHCDKGGFYALDAVDGRMDWFFDLESGTVYRPSGEVHEFDPSYYGPPGARGCGSIWASPALDPTLGLLFVASADCDRTPMPAYDEAVFALDLEGNPVWRWRPREYDVRDMDFGATPNAFVLPNGRRVVGAAGKDGVYYVLDAATGTLVWGKKLVVGGNFGGFYNGTTDGRRIYLAHGIGPASDIAAPHEEALRGRAFALDVRTGNLLWRQHVGAPTVGQNSAIPGVFFTGGLDHVLHAYDAATGDVLWAAPVGGASSSTPVVVDGEIYIGSGTGATYRAAVGCCPIDPFGTPLGQQHLPHPIPVGEYAQGVIAFCLATEPSCVADRAEVSAPGGTAALPATGQTVLIAHTQQLDAYDVDAGSLGNLVPTTSWVNGQTCFIPGDPAGRFVQASDNPAFGGETDPWWGVFDKDGTWTGTKIMTGNEGEPAGCAFDRHGNLIAVDVGLDHTPFAGDGFLVKFFGPDFTTWCVLDTGLSQPGFISLDGKGRVYVPEAGAARIGRYSNLPASASDCTAPTEEAWFDGFQNGVFTPIAISKAPFGWAVSSVLVPAGVFHVTERGDGVGVVDGVYAAPSALTGNPFGIGFDTHGNLYYADLGLGPTGDPEDPIGPLDGLGSLKVVPAEGAPAPRTIASGLSYPDGITVVPTSAVG